MTCLTIAILAALALSSAALPQPALAGTVYHVAVNGSDRQPGSDRRPLRTIGRAVARAGAGDLIVVRPGAYSESVVVDRSGAPGAPIIIRGLAGAVLVSPDGAGSLSAFDFAPGTAYVTLQGFELGGGFAETVFLRPGTHDIELAGLHIHDNRSGVWIAGAANVLVRDCVIDHNFRTGVRIFAGARNVRIIDTRSQANDDGLGCEGDSDGFNADETTSDIVFERARAVGNSEDGFDLRSRNATLLQTITQGNGCSGVKIAAGGYLENLLAERNRIGLNVSAPAGATTAVENCTLAENALGLRAGGSGHTLLVRNSIIAGPAKALSYPATVQLVEGHNILYRPLAKDRLIVRQEGASEVLYSGDDINGGTWRRASGQGDATVARDPRFASASRAPRSDSVAIDSGDDNGAPPIDLDGTARPVGAAVDRGAFEWNPVQPALIVQRAVLRANRMGSGNVRLRAAVTIPAGSALGSDTKPTGVAIRGARGDVLRVTLPAAAWKRSGTAGGSVWRAAQVNAAGHVTRLTLQVGADRVSFWVTGGGADMWALDGQSATVAVEFGGWRASAGTTLRAAGRVLSLP